MEAKRQQERKIGRDALRSELDKGREKNHYKSLHEPVYTKIPGRILITDKFY